MREFDDEVEILAAPLVAGYGGVMVRDWANATVVVAPASVQPVSTTEDDGDRQTTVERWRLRLSAFRELRSTSRVRWRGRVFDVDGEVEVWDVTRARHGHKAATLRLAVDT